MELSDYLKKIRECPDEKLTDEYGIYDNWPIFLNANFDSVVEHLKQSENYKHNKTSQERGKIRHLFEYDKGTIVLQTYNWIPFFFCHGSKEDKERQKRDYNMTIMLHPYQEKKIEGIDDLRALAMIIDDIGQFVIREKIPTCMSSTIGWKYLNDKDYLKIVYYPK